MPKLALLVATFLFFVFLLQQSSSGVFEDFEYVGTDNDLKLESDIISTDTHETQNDVKRYLVFGSGSLHDAHPQIENLVYELILAVNFSQWVFLTRARRIN